MDDDSNLRRLMLCESLITMMPCDIKPSIPNYYTVHKCFIKLDNQRLETKDWRLNSDMITDYEKHHSDLKNVLPKAQEDLESKLMQEYNKLYNQVHYIIAVNNKDIEIGSFTHAALINKLIKMAFDSINNKEDDGAINNSLNYLINMEMLSMTCEMVEKLIRVLDDKFGEINVLCAKSPMDFGEPARFFQEPIQRHQLLQQEGTEVASRPKLIKENKDNKPKGLTCSESVFKL
ncbi:DNA topoisomerase 2, partial [Massospora cicadina]